MIWITKCPKKEKRKNTFILHIGKKYHFHISLKELNKIVATGTRSLYQKGVTP